MTETTFPEFRCDAPELDQLKGEMTELSQAFLDAVGHAERVGVIQDWDRLNRRVGTWFALVMVRFRQNVDDEVAKAAREVADAMSPELTELDNQFKKLLIESPYRAELEAEFGDTAFRLWQADLDSFAPEIKELMRVESKLENQYTELKASAKIDFEGATHNLPAMGAFTSDGDRDRRAAATAAVWAWYEQEGAEQHDDPPDPGRSRGDGMAVPEGRVGRPDTGSGPHILLRRPRDGRPSRGGPRLGGLRESISVGRILRHRLLPQQGHHAR